MDKWLRLALELRSRPIVRRIRSKGKERIPERERERERESWNFHVWLSNAIACRKSRGKVCCAPTDQDVSPDAIDQSLDLSWCNGMITGERNHYPVGTVETCVRMFCFHLFYFFR